MTVHVSKPVLIVDDEESLLEMLAMWLRDEGYDVVTFSRFEDARRYLANETPSALVADIRLGAFNGLQLAALLHDRAPEVPILVLSAYEDSTLKEEAERLGGVFLAKPLLREEIVDALRRWDLTARDAG